MSAIMDAITASNLADDELRRVAAARSRGMATAAEHRVARDAYQAARQAAYDALAARGVVWDDGVQLFAEAVAR